MRAQEFIVESTTVERDGITLDYQFSTDQQKLKITALSNGRRLGSAEFQNYGPVDSPEYKGDQVEVDERYRGQGIATIMYDLAKELVGQIYPSPSQTSDGERFWKGKPVWEQELNEFDPGEGGFGPFKVYYEQDYFIGQFPTFEEAKGEVDFLRDSDPKSATHHWRIVDGTGETVWEYDIGADIDARRRSQKFQRRP
jgi:GNAT superfamily N-acetyltransferase